MNTVFDIGRIPDDLLHEFFSTCRRWRELALNRSHYWSRLVLDGTKSKSLLKLRDKAALWSTRRAQGQIETTLLYGSRPFFVLPLLSYITFPQRRIIFHGENPHRFIIRQPSDTPTGPNIVLPTDTFQPAPLFPLKNITKSLVWDLEQRPSIKIFGQGIEGSLFTEQHPTPQLPFGHIRKLVLLSLPFSVVTECRETVEFLSAFPLLESLEIGSATHTAGPRECISMQPLPLPNLRFVHVKRCAYFNCLLTHLRIPNLKQLIVYAEYTLDGPSQSIPFLPSSNLGHTPPPRTPPVLPHPPAAEPLATSLSEGNAPPQTSDQIRQPWPVAVQPGSPLGGPTASTLSTPDLQNIPPQYPWPTSITTLHLLNPKIRQSDYLWIFKNLRQLETLKLQPTTNEVVSLLCPQAAENWDPLPVLKHLEITFSSVTGPMLISMINSRKASESVSALKDLTISCCNVSKGERAVLEQSVNLLWVGS